MMRKIAATATLSLATLTGVAVPATAVEIPTTVAVEVPASAAVDTAVVAPVAEDDNGGWGLWGLLGLIGLAGLFKKNKTKTVPVERDEYGPGTTGPGGADPVR